MKNEYARAREFFDIVKHAPARAAAMDRYDAAACVAAFNKNMLEDGNLDIPMAAKLRIAIESYFTNIR